jgi:hypothetical protein
MVSLRVAPSDTEEGRYRATWSSNEAGVRYTCSLDAGAPFNCESGYSFTLLAGTHSFTVTPEDSSGNVGAGAQVNLSVVETVLDEAPDEGAHVAASRFAAHTVPGTALECSLDGGAWFACGGASGPLTLPTLHDGEHAVRARGVLNGEVDRFPAKRTWTVDTMPPETVLAGYRLTASEPVASSRCRLDGADVPCTTVLPSTPGEHTFAAAGVDRAGTRLVVSGPAGYTLTVKRPGKRARATTVKKLVGSKLPKRTRITGRAGGMKTTIRLR